MNDNDDKNLFNDYDETETCVYDGINTTTFLGSTSDYLPGAPTGWYPPGGPEEWNSWPRKVRSGQHQFFSVNKSGNMLHTKHLMK